MLLAVEVVVVVVGRSVMGLLKFFLLVFLGLSATVGRKTKPAVVVWAKYGQNLANLGTNTSQTTRPSGPQNTRIFRPFSNWLVRTILTESDDLIFTRIAPECGILNTGSLAPKHSICIDNGLPVKMDRENIEHFNQTT